MKQFFDFFFNPVIFQSISEPTGKLKFSKEQSLGPVLAGFPPLITSVFRGHDFSLLRLPLGTSYLPRGASFSSHLLGLFSLCVPFTTHNQILTLLLPPVGALALPLTCQFSLQCCILGPKGGVTQGAGSPPCKEILHSVQTNDHLQLCQKSLFIFWRKKTILPFVTLPTLKSQGDPVPRVSKKSHSVEMHNLSFS